MKGAESLMGWLVKLIFVLMLLPALISVVFQLTAAVLFAVLPWIIGIAIIVGIVAGVSAGLTVRRCFPPRNGNLLPPGEAPAVRRPRGRGHGDN